MIPPPIADVLKMMHVIQARITQKFSYIPEGYNLSA